VLCLLSYPSMMWPRGLESNQRPQRCRPQTIDLAISDNNSVWSENLNVRVVHNYASTTGLLWQVKDATGRNRTCAFRRRPSAWRDPIPYATPPLEKGRQRDELLPRRTPFIYEEREIQFMHSTRKYTASRRTTQGHQRAATVPYPCQMRTVPSTLAEARRAIPCPVW